ncbi:MAG: hypothetical protein V2A58_01040 [Planctomycetota bacterium]
MVERKVHQRLNEYLSCYSATDVSAELAKLAGAKPSADVTQDRTELALKYLALAILQAVAERASELTIGQCDPKSNACYLVGKKTCNLPLPAGGIIETAQEILTRIADLRSQKPTGKIILGLADGEVACDARLENVAVVLKLPKLERA